MEKIEETSEKDLEQNQSIIKSENDLPKQIIQNSPEQKTEEKPMDIAKVEEENKSSE